MSLPQICMNRKSTREKVLLRPELLPLKIKLSKRLCSGLNIEMEGLFFRVVCRAIFGFAMVSMAWTAACKGVRNTGRIINGTEVYPPHKYPWAVKFFVRWLNGTFYGCGGSLLSDRIVLTAAHCINDSTIVLVRAGAHNYTEDEIVDKRIQTRKKAQLVPHEKYMDSDFPDMQYDIGLIVVDPAFQFNDWIGVINISNHETLPNTMLTMIGWGRIGYDPIDPRSSTFVLMEAQTRSMSLAEARPWYNTTLTDANIFTQSEGNTSACYGDSGSPVFNADHELIGVVSSGNILLNCSGPSANVNVFKYLSWILENMEKLEGRSTSSTSSTASLFSSTSQCNLILSFALLCFMVHYN